jgi:hypothetical protein
MRNYFALRPVVKFPTWTIWFFVFGLCSFFGVLGNMSSSGGAAFTFFILTGILAGVGALGVYFAYGPARAYDSRPTITDQAFDAWVEWQRQHSLENGCRRLNVDYNQLSSHTQVIRDPICIQGFQRSSYLVPTTTTAANERFVIGEYRVGNDGISRWRQNVFIWFLPQEHQLAAYTYGIDAIVQNLTEDKTQEFFYQAVSGISTSQDRLKGRGTGPGAVDISATSFSLSIDSGEKMTMPVTPLEAHLRVRDSGLEQAINSLRELLRNKKQQMLPGGFAPGYPPTGYPPSGGYAPQGYPPSGGYAPQGAPPNGGYPPTGYPPSGGYAPQGYPSNGGYAPQGYPPSGGYAPVDPQGAPPNYAQGYPTNAPTMPGANDPQMPPPPPAAPPQAPDTAAGA